MSIIERAAEKMRLAAEAAAADGANAGRERHADDTADAPDTPGTLPAASDAEVIAANATARGRERSSIERATLLAAADIGGGPSQLTALAEQAAPAVARPGARTSRRIELDLDALHAAGFLNGRDQSPHLRDEMRRLKRPLLSLIKSAAMENGSNGLPNIVLVTSSLPGEGKTFLSVNLSISLASEIDQTVLLIDGDFRRRSTSELLRIGESPGLIDLLEARGTGVPDVLLRTNIEHLAVIPAGRPHALVDELFASEVAGNVLAEISARYDDRIVIIDAPPVLLTSEPMVLAQWARHVLFVVEADVTPQQRVLGALKILQADGKVRLVLNKSSRRAAALGRDAYGSYYYYRS
jgi:exopolysaccharide/PEP-CTERM locus tyrosine autokinase